MGVIFSRVLLLVVLLLPVGGLAQSNTPTPVNTSTPTVTPTFTPAVLEGMLFYRDVCATPTCVSTTSGQGTALQWYPGQGGGLKTVYVSGTFADPNDTITVQAECRGSSGDEMPWVVMGSALNLSASTTAGKVEEDAWCEEVRLNVTAEACAGTCPALSGWVFYDPPRSQ